MDEEVVSTLKKVAKGSILLLVSLLIYHISFFFFRVLLARNLSVSDYGSFFFMYSVTTFLLVLSLLGIHIGVAKLIPEWRSRRKNPSPLVGTSILIVLTSSFFLSLFLYILYPFLTSSVSVPQEIYIFFVLSVPLGALLFLAVNIARGFEDFKPKAYFMDILRGVILLITAILSTDLFVSSLGFFASFLFSALFSLLYIFSLIRPSISFSLVRYLLSFSLPLILIAFLSRIMFSADTFFVGILLGSSSVGIYSASVTLAILGSFLLNVVGFAFFPIITSLLTEKKYREADRFYKLVTKWIVFLSLPIFLAFLLYPSHVLAILFGPEYTSGHLTLQILVLGFLVHTVLGANGVTLISIGDRKGILLGLSSAVVINILFNFLLIPLFGITGAALATSISLILLNVYMSYRLWKKTGITPLYRNFYIPFISSILSLFFVRILLYFLPPFLELLVYFLLYILLTFLLGFFEKEDITLFRQLEKKLGLPPVFSRLSNLLRH